MGSLALVSITPLWPPRSYPTHVWSGRSSDFESKKYVDWAGPSLLPYLFCSSLPGVSVLRDESLITLPWGAWGVGGRLLPSASVLKPLQFISRSVVSNSLKPHVLYSPWNSPGRILEWVAFPFSRESSQPRDWTQVSWIAGGFFTSWVRREASDHSINGSKKLIIHTKK